MEDVILRFIRLLFYFSTFFSCASLANEAGVELRIPNPRSAFDISHDYYTNLITKAFKKGSSEHSAPRLIQTFPMQQGRAFNELKRGENIDLFWMGTDRYKERQLTAVKIPLERGLMGFRRFIIHRDNQALFDSLSSLEELSQLTACQGTHWPDRKILEHAGLRVEASPVYEHHFDKLSAKRCDYFPRGFHEGIAEIEQRKHLYPDLMLYEKIVLYYPFTVYAFFSEKYKALAKQLEDGLHQMIADGSFEQHMSEHPLTAHVFPLSQWQDSLILHIENPDISKEQIKQQTKFWLQPGSSGNVFTN